MLKNEILKVCDQYIPDDLIISNLHWKTILFSVFNSKNLLISGPTGSGKTLAILTLEKLFNKDSEFGYRPFFNIPMGGSQDARSTLIGNTHLNKETGTWFGNSKFVNAIHTENAIILLDEINRGSLQSGNILMSVLDKNQRFLRIDNSPTTPDIKLAKGVSIIATANIGREYTATNIFDKAFKGRFTYFEMPIIDIKQEIKLQTYTYPNLDVGIIEQICSIAEFTRYKYKEGDMNYYISTKHIVEYLEKRINDVYDFEEAFEIEIFNLIDNEDDVILIRQYLDANTQ